MRGDHLEGCLRWRWSKWCHFHDGKVKGGTPMGVGGWGLPRGEQRGPDVDGCSKWMLSHPKRCRYGGGEDSEGVA